MAYYIVNFSDVSKVNITDLFHFSNPKCGFDARFEHIEYINGDPVKGWISNKKTLGIGDMFSVYKGKNEIAIVKIIDTCEKIDDNNSHISQYKISYAPLVIPMY